jgi:hypothetical protein
VILSVLVCDILINVLLQTSALVGPLYDFTGEQDGGQFICFYVTVGASLFTNPMDVVWHHRSASATTPWFVMKFCTSYFIFFIRSYLSPQ